VPCCDREQVLLERDPSLVKKKRKHVDDRHGASRLTVEATKG